MDKNIFIRKSALRPTEEQRLLTQPFYRNANTIYQHFDDWKGIDQFYFIPLYLEMTYSINGIIAEMAPDPVWMGSFVRCTLEHPDLFRFKCPQCGKAILPYRYCGSPLSGRVDLDGNCCCGWKGFESVAGWRSRAVVLRDIQKSDSIRFVRSKLFHRGLKASTIGMLLDKK